MHVIYYISTKGKNIVWKIKVYKDIHFNKEYVYTHKKEKDMSVTNFSNREQEDIIERILFIIRNKQWEQYIAPPLLIFF